MEPRPAVPRSGRRHFLIGAGVAAATTFLGLPVGRAAAERPPETTRITVFQPTSLCTAPTVVADELLRAEGFTEVTRVPATTVSAGLSSSRRVGAGDFDLSLNFAAPLVVSLDAGTPVVVLAGIHVGCLELVANDRLHTIRDLKGKAVPLDAFGSVPHVFLAAMITHVGLDPNKDVRWVLEPYPRHVQLFQEGKVDALVAFPPLAQQLRARKIGRVVVVSAVDRPWSQYFCCMVEANREFVRRHPVATKRALRAVLKATSLCATDPEGTARALVAKGFATDYEAALQTMKELPYAEWRVYDPADALRFYALRLREAGMIKALPQKLLAEGTDWRFLDELKRELKG